jgi:DNA repair protein RecO (recombination protein O)
MGLSRIHQATGIVLKRKNIGETDKIVTLFTKEFGKISCIAKGVRSIRSRRGGHIELFHHVQVTLHEGKSGLDSLTEAQTIHTNELLGSSILNVSYAYYVAELIDVLTPDRQKQEDVYDLLQHVFSSLCSCTTNAQRNALVSLFATTLLQTLGFLDTEKQLPASRITPFVESIIERKLKVPRVMHLL